MDVISAEPTYPHKNTSLGKQSQHVITPHQLAKEFPCELNVPQCLLNDVSLLNIPMGHAIISSLSLR